MFFKGIRVSILRDASFGIIYEVNRGYLRSLLSASQSQAVPYTFAADAVGAVFACMTVAPLNFARNMVYATPPDTKPPSFMACMRLLGREVMAHPRPLMLLDAKLLLRWGAFRTAIGMGLGQSIYEHVKPWLSHFS